MIRHVVAVLCLGQPVEPRVGAIAGDAVEVHCNGFVHRLRLPVHLGMECRDEVEIDADELEEIMANMTGEHGSRSLMMDSGNPCRRTMASKNALATEVAM